MTTCNLDQRVAELEKKITRREGLHVIGASGDGTSLVLRELEIQGLEARLKELEYVEKVARAVLIKAQKGYLDV